MKKIITFFSVLILLLPIAIAETQIFSGKVITDQEKVIDGNIFKFTYDESSNKLFVQNPSQSLIIENGKCKSNNVFRICINSANFSDRNITTYVTYYEIDTIIYKITGSLSAVSTATSTSLLQKDSADLTITITNPTDVDVTNLKYEENLTGFAVTYVDGCTLKDNKLSWSGSIPSNSHKVCTATLVAQQEGTYNLVGSLNYSNGFETEKKATDTLTITVLPHQLAVNQMIDNDVEIQQPFYINVSLQNINLNEKIDLAITVDIPWNFELLNKMPYFSRDVNVLKSSSKMDPGSSFNYSLYLKGNAESKIPIKQTFEYKIKSISYVIENDTFVNSAEPKPVINLSTDSAEVTPGEKFIVSAQIRNPSKIYELTNIKAKLSAPYNNDAEQNLNKLMPGDSYSIISSTLSIPKSSIEELDKTIKLNLNVEYNFNDVIKSINKSVELKIKSLNATTSNATIRKDSAQNSNEAKINQTASIESNVSNKPNVIETKIEQPKPTFFTKENLVIIASVFLTLLVVTFIIIKIGKRKKGIEQLKEKVVKDLEEELNKPKTF